MRGDALALRDRLLEVFAWAAALSVAGAFVSIILSLVADGYRALSWSFLTTAPADAGRAGGILPILVSTAIILALALIVVVPLGLATAVFLSEYADRRSLLGRGVRIGLDLLAGIPSVVFGLFGNAVFCHALGMGFSLLSGALTLACMVLPLFIRIAESSLSRVDPHLRAAAFSLGMRDSRVILHIVIPHAIPGLTVALILSIGRALSETAALIFTSGYVDRLPHSVFDSGRALTLHIYDLAMNIPGGSTNAAGSALVLIAALVLINSFAWKCAAWYEPGRHHRRPSFPRRLFNRLFRSRS